MPTVYLPMGYPVQTGQQFDLIVFQGNLVRSYTLPKDPRSDSALFQRRFLSDVSKMRSFLGDVGRLALMEALGSTWSTVLFQIIKSDSFGWWSGAQQIWDALQEDIQQAWRDAAPYKVTFNDMGWIFFGLVRVMYEAIDYYAKGVWESEQWSPENFAGALGWYGKNKGSVWWNGIRLYAAEEIKYYGNWSEASWSMPNQSGMQMVSSGSQDDFAEVLLYGKWFYIEGRGASNLGVGEAFIDGQKIGEMDFSILNTYQYLTFDSTKRRARSLVLKPLNGSRIAFYQCSVNGGEPSA